MKGAKKTISTENTNSVAKKRKLKLAKYRTFRLSKPIKSPKPPLPSSWQLLKTSLNIIKSNKRFFGVISLIYGLLSYFFIKAANSGQSISQMQSALTGSIDGTFARSVTVYGVLLGSSTQVKNQISGIYQAIILITISLAIIYGLRHIAMAKKRVTAKESLYKGMTAVIPFILVLIVIGLELLPFGLGSGIYASVVSTGIAVTAVEKVLWQLFVISLGLLTFYMISSSIFALYIVTLPDMKPVKALKAARELVRYRRMAVVRKLLFLALAILSVMAIVIVPLIAYLPVVADVIFFLASIAVLPFVHTYVYTLYRKML
jgi:hypothetical protein